MDDGEAWTREDMGTGSAAGTGTDLDLELLLESVRLVETERERRVGEAEVFGSNRPSAMGDGGRRYAFAYVGCSVGSSLSRSDS
jgi:hypothetical protein